MLRHISTPIFLATLAASPMAVHADLEWDFAGVGTGVVYDDYDNSAYEFQSDVVNVGSHSGPTDVSATVAGWSPDSGTVGDTLEDRDVNTWSGSGLGVNTNGESSPDHSTDNSGPAEFVLFSFEQAITLTEVTIGWKYTDSDLTVLAYTGANTSDPLNAGPSGNFSTLTYERDNPNSLTNNGWSLIGNYSNLNVDVPRAINTGEVDPVSWDDGHPVGNVASTQVSSSYWLIGAYNPQVNGPDWSDYDDFVKIASITGHVPTPPSTGVPEPATMMLLALGVPLAGGLRKLRR